MIYEGLECWKEPGSGLEVDSSIKARGRVFPRALTEVTLKNPTGLSLPSSLVAATQAGVGLLFICLSSQGCLAIWQGAWH